MDIFKFLLLSLFLLLLPFISAANPPSCPSSTCFNSNFAIRFPFQAILQAPSNCGYPGFYLSCDNQGNTVISFPYSGDFFVRGINYQEQEIQLYDPYSCLPRRLMDGLNLSGTPFQVSYYLNYTFMLCPTEFTQSRFAVIDCLSNSTNSTMATTSNTLVERMASRCKVLVTIPIPVPWPMPESDSGITSELNGDLQLYWEEPNCEDCETQGAMCGFENNTNQQVICFDSPGTGTTNHLRLIKMISLTIAIPTIICAFCTACICLVHGRRSHGTAGQQNFDPIVTPQPPNTSFPGLDQSTIESYTKVVLGESRRLPMGPNDGTCPICLSDYRAEEVVRCIPECQHCFHAGCIDEWLRLNKSCPVCRNSPSPAHGNQQPV